MPLIKSAKKRVRTSARREQVNLLHRSGSKTAVRTATRAIAANQTEAADLTKLAVSRLDRATSKGSIKKNKAARLKSRLTSKLKAISKSK
jgi:small subunit ribosomal protein S20